MNPSSSSKNHKAKCYQSQSQAPSKMERKQKKKQIPRNPLQDLNVTNTDVSDRSGNSIKISTSVSVEAPRGCLRFFLSQSSSMKTPFSRPLKSIPKTPKSAPSVSAIKSSSKSKSTFSKENLPKRTVSGKGFQLKTQKPNRNPPCLYHWPSGKKSSSQDAVKSKKNSYVSNSNNSVVNKLLYESGEVKQPEEQRMVLTCDGRDTNLTPTKLATPLGIDDRVVDKVIDAERSNTSNSNNRTPPVQVSVSPEIQCGSSSFSTATPACFGAGYVVSGVPDKRKCRPRGILTVGDNDLGFIESKALNNFDDIDEEDEAVVNHSIASIVPLPAEASMHWLLSPCNEEDEDEKENSDDGSCASQRPTGFKVCQNPMPFFDNQEEFSSDLCNTSYSRSVGSNSNDRRRKSNSMRSSADVSELRGLFGSLCNDGVVSSSPQATACEAIPEPKEKMQRCNVDGEKSPLSMDTLGSENVMQTPQSELSSDRYVGPSQLKFEDRPKHQLDSEVNSSAVNLQMASLSSKSHESIWGATSSSFQFDSLTMPSDSVDMSQFHKFLRNRDSWISNSTLDYLSQSQMRISWREGLASRIFELDELDSCRCLSDEEEDFSGWTNDPLKSPMSPEINVGISNDQIHTFQSIDYAEESASEGKDRGSFPFLGEKTCAESISTDGGGLVRSEDSDWTLCYKNHLFEV